MAEKIATASEAAIALNVDTQALDIASNKCITLNEMYEVLKEHLKDNGFLIELDNAQYFPGGSVTLSGETIQSGFCVAQSYFGSTYELSQNICKVRSGSYYYFGFKSKTQVNGKYPYYTLDCCCSMSALSEYLPAFKEIYTDYMLGSTTGYQKPKICLLSLFVSATRTDYMYIAYRNNPINMVALGTIFNNVYNKFLQNLYSEINE